MAYGICSIIAYLLFLIWVIITRNNSNYDYGNVVVFSTNFGQIGGMTSTLGTAFSIQGFFVPVLKRYKNREKHVFIVFIAYIIGVSAYVYIALLGSFGSLAYI